MAEPSAPTAARDAPVLCTHCGLPVPSGLVEAGAEQQFCCNGCREKFAADPERYLDPQPESGPPAPAGARASGG